MIPRAQANEKRTVRGGVVHTIRRSGRTGLRSWLRVLLSGAIIIVLGPFEFLQGTRIWISYIGPYFDFEIWGMSKHENMTLGGSISAASKSILHVLHIVIWLYPILQFFRSTWLAHFAPLQTHFFAKTILINVIFQYVNDVCQFFTNGNLMVVKCWQTFPKCRMSVVFWPICQVSPMFENDLLIFW